MLGLALLAAITITADFEGGSLGAVRPLADHWFQCALEGETDQDGRNRQATWYYFRIDGAENRPLTIDLVGLAGEYNYRPNKGGVSDKTPPVVSYDRERWAPLTSVEYDPETPRLRLKLRPERSPVWIAHVPPYTTEHLRRLLDDIRAHPHLEERRIGKTAEGRDMVLLTVSDPSAPARAKKVVWLMFRQHAWESGSSWAAEGALRFLLSSTETARRIRRETIFQIFPMCDPDGVARGGVRFNRYGYDLNRNWDAVDPRTMPEIAAQRSAVLEWFDAGRRIDLFVTLHNTETAEYLEGPPAGHTRLMNRFFRILRDTTTFNPTRPARPAATSTSPGKPGRMTVNQGLYRDRRIPAFLIEQMIARNSRLGRVPTIADRMEFGAGLVRAAWQAVWNR